MSEQEKFFEDHPLEAKLHQALREVGLLLPTTVEDVAAAEADFDESSIELPERLEDPVAVFRSTGDPRFRFPAIAAPTSPGTSENLARAAREGTSLPPEVEEQMRRDREAAEKEQQQTDD